MSDGAGTLRRLAGGAQTAATADGAALVERHRCGACHAGLPAPSPAAPLVARTPLAVLAVLRPGDGAVAHPDFRLAQAEALAVALAMGGAEDGAGAGELRRLRREHPQATPELGFRIARGLNCGGCHAGLPAEPGTGPVLAVLAAGSQPGWLHAFLRAPRAVRPFGTRSGSGARMPDFGLTDAEADSIATFLLARAAELPPLAAGVPSPLTAQAAATADALLDLLSCRGCHERGGRGGRIGPSLDDVLSRRTPAYITALIRDPQRFAPGSGMPRPPDARVEQVIRLLATTPAAITVERSWLSPLEHALVDADGAPPAYVRWCAACHGATGRGDGYNAGFLRSAPAVHASDTAMSARADDTLYDGIAAGGASLGRSPEMPQFSATLPAAEIRELVRYIRTLCACTGPAWSREPAR